MRDYPPVDQLLPHAAPMVLIDRLLAHEAGVGATCSLTVRRGAPFEKEGRVATLVALEYMAQSVGVYAGYTPFMAGEPVEVGFLIGCSRMKSERPWLPVGTELRVDVEQVWGDARLAQFDCSVQLVDGTSVAQARLSVAQMPGVLASH